MDVYDSGVWVWGLTQSAPDAEGFVEEAIEGDRFVALNTYIHREVIKAFDRATTADSDEIRNAKKHFNVIISKRHNVEFVDHEAIGQMDIYQVREQQPIQLFGLSWEIQPKDVPIILLAEALSRPTTVYTTDHDLAEFDPADAGIDGVTVELVSTP